MRSRGYVKNRPIFAEPRPKTKPIWTRTLAWFSAKVGFVFEVDPTGLPRDYRKGIRPRSRPLPSGRRGGNLDRLGNSNREEVIKPPTSSFKGNPIVIARRLLMVLAVIGVAQIAAAQEPSKDQQAEQIKKQIEELNKKLADLQKPEAPRGAGAAGGGDPEGMAQGAAVARDGPAAMGGRIVAMTVVEADSSTYWIATASGGLLKTENNGITFAHQFDKESTVSIGDVAVAPSDKNILYVGTGESNPRNSVSYGDGVYKSTDGGKSWKNVGLKKSFQVGRVIVHPKDPNIVYVGALGRLYGPSEERGLYKSTDGGQNWSKVLYIDDKTGIIDACFVVDLKNLAPVLTRPGVCTEPAPRSAP